jgi:fluoride ion exporter CrcB/FEX
MSPSLWALTLIQKRRRIKNIIESATHAKGEYISGGHSTTIDIPKEGKGAMAGPLIAVVGDATPTRTFNPVMRDAAKAKKAAEDLGAELAKRGARLLVYGGPFIEADFVRGFVTGKPAEDRSILMWYSKDMEPPPFNEEQNYPKLFERRAEKGADWEIAFYRAISRADGVILIGGGNATKIAGQVAIGAKIPILTLAEFGGAASQVWDTLSAGEDLPNRDEINTMARPWSSDSATILVNALLAQQDRRLLAAGSPRPISSILAGLLFLAALAIIPIVLGRDIFAVWMLFLAPLLAGGSGAIIRPIIDRLRGTQGVTQALLATLVLGLVAGGLAGVLFVTAQFTGEPDLATASKIAQYAQRSVPYAVGIGFVAGLTSDVVFSKLLGTDVVRTAGISAGAPRT